MNKHTGGCLCGSVRFELNKEPDFAYGCHCRFCQKATGTAFRSGLRCQKSSVKFNDSDVADDISRSLILEQVKLGVAIRMAIIKELI